jgi:hypothetical protein
VKICKFKTGGILHGLICYLPLLTDASLSLFAGQKPVASSGSAHAREPLLYNSQHVGVYVLGEWSLEGVSLTSQFTVCGELVRWFMLVICSSLSVCVQNRLFHGRVLCDTRFKTGIVEHTSQLDRRIQTLA